MLTNLGKGLFVVENLALIDLKGVYIIVGTLVLTNLGTIGGGFLFFIKLSWKVAVQKTTYDLELQTLRKDMNAAHEKIRRLENGER